MICVLLFVRKVVTETILKDVADATTETPMAVEKKDDQSLTGDQSLIDDQNQTGDHLIVHLEGDIIDHAVAPGREGVAKDPDRGLAHESDQSDPLGGGVTEIGPKSVTGQ